MIAAICQKTYFKIIKSYSSSTFFTWLSININIVFSRKKTLSNIFFRQFPLMNNTNNMCTGTWVCAVERVRLTSTNWRLPCRRSQPTAWCAQRERLGWCFRRCVRSTTNSAVGWSTPAAPFCHQSSSAVLACALRATADARRAWDTCATTSRTPAPLCVPFSISSTTASTSAPVATSMDSGRLLCPRWQLLMTSRLGSESPSEDTVFICSSLLMSCSVF